jgi:hypothetical protein
MRNVVWIAKNDNYVYNKSTYDFIILNDCIIEHNKDSKVESGG